MCSFSERTGSSASPLFLPALDFFQWNPKPCATPSATDDNDKPQQKETSPFPSLHNEVVASFIHLQRTNPVSGVREELNSILKRFILSTNYMPGTGLGVQSWVIFQLPEGNVF